MNNTSITILPETSFVVVSVNPSFNVDLVNDENINIKLEPVGLRGPPGSRVVEIAVFLGGNIAPLEHAVRTELTQPLTLLPSLCKASCDHESSLNVVFNVKADDISIGTVTFLPNSLDGTIEITEGVTSIGPCLLRIIAPELLGGLRDVSITISGER